MTIASTSRSRVAYIPEVTWGVTPATPAFQEMRRTSGNLATKKGTVTSDEIRLDRNIRDEYMVSQDVTGSYDLELSYGSYDDLLAAAMFGDWSSNVLWNGSTEKSFTFEETVDLGGGNYAYSRYLGCEVSTLALTFNSRAAVKGSFSIMGKQETTDSAIIAGATYTAPNTNKIETAVSVASLAIAGMTPVPKIKALSLNINNGLRIRDRIGSLYSEQFGMGQADITGSFDAYFESNALYDQVLAHGGGALSLTVGAVTAKKYTFDIPNAIFTDGSKKLGGKNDDVMVTIPFRAVYDGSNGSMKITRAVA